MKFAAKKAAKPKKSAKAKKAAKPKKIAAPLAVAAAAADDFELPESFAVDAGPAVSAETLLLLAIAEVSTLVKLTEVDGFLETVPDDLRIMSFNDDRVGISNEQMPAVLLRVAEGIGEPRVTKLIQKRMLTPPNSALVVRNVYAQIQLWVDNPGIS